MNLIKVVLTLSLLTIYSVLFSEKTEQSHLFAQYVSQGKMYRYNKSNNEKDQSYYVLSKYDFYYTNDSHNQCVVYIKTKVGQRDDLIQKDFFDDVESQILTKFVLKDNLFTIYTEVNKAFKDKKISFEFNNGILFFNSYNAISGYEKNILSIINYNNPEYFYYKEYYDDLRIVSNRENVTDKDEYFLTEKALKSIDRLYNKINFENMHFQNLRETFNGINELKLEDNFLFDKETKKTSLRVSYIIKNRNGNGGIKYIFNLENEKVKSKEKSTF